ncbi:MAG: carboxypeptidase-like regulatory domain-containing protein [Bacteroidales bacterium]
MSAAAGLSQTVHSEKLYGEVKTSDGESLPYTNIINTNQHLGTTTNREGQFVIHVAQNDTIKLTSIGYRTTYYIIQQVNEYSLNKTFILDKDTVNLSEVVIYPYPSTYKALKREFIALELDEETPLIDLHLDKAGISPQPSTGATISGPFSLIYDKLSRHGKLQRKFERSTKQDEIRLQVSNIYNSSLVADITGLKDEQLIEDFMKFCKLEPEFILNSTSYQIHMAIHDCYIEFINKPE